MEDYMNRLMRCGLQKCDAYSLLMSMRRSYTDKDIEDLIESMEHDAFEVPYVD